ncbi:hypothetical protein, partial [Candidatus Darwinibacter acetoxidans]
QVFSFSSSSGTMNVAHGSSLNNDLVLHPYIVSESRELFFHLILQVADCAPLLYPLDKLVEDGYAKRQ